MTSRTVEHHDHSGTDFAWLEDRVRTWVEADLITAEEGAAVEDYERRADARCPRPALGLPAEVVAYVGIVLALAGALVGLRPHWDAIPLVARFALAMAVAVVGFACGTWLVGLAETGTRRLGTFLWVLGSAGVALGSSVVVDAIDPSSSGWSAIAVGLPLMTVGLALWRNLERPLQLITWAAGLGAALAGVGVLLGWDTWVIGCVAWILAAGWLALGLRMTLRPIVVARCLGSVASLLAAFMLMELDERVGSLVATLTGALIIALGLWTGMIAVLVVGALGTLLATQTLVQTTLHGAGAAVALLLGGLLMVVTIVLRLRRQRTDQG